MNNNSDILDLITSYSQNELDDLYFTLKKELNSQKKLNKILKEDNYDINIKNIKNFISRNSRNIDYQFEELSKITSELKQIVNENKQMKNQYDEIINSKECIDISNKLKEIKIMKQNIIYFLEATGI